MNPQKLETVKHSIIPLKRRKHGFDVEHPRNFATVERLFSKRLKRLFGSQTPSEQLGIFYLVNYRVLQDEIREELKAIGLLPGWDFYDELFIKEVSSLNGERFHQHLSQGLDLFPKKGPKKKFDAHHMIPRSRRSDGFETNRRINTVRLNIEFHANWHRAFLNHHPAVVAAF